MLKWILDLLVGLKSSVPEDGVLRLLLPLAEQYLDEFVQSELLSRRLAYLCARKLSVLAATAKGSNANSTRPSNATPATVQNGTTNG